MQPGLNNEFRIFFKPKVPESRNKRYIPVGVYQLQKYIGHDNANKAIQTALNMRVDKWSRKYRSSGTVIFYLK